MPTGDIYQLDIVAVASGEYVENVLHCRQVSAGSDTDPRVIAQAIMAGWHTANETAWLACFANDYKLTGYRCKRVNPLGGLHAYQPTPSTSGSVTAVSVASSLGAVLLQGYKSATTNKFRTGRLFLPSAPSAYIQENGLSTAYITAINALLSLLNSVFSATDTSTYYWGTYTPKTDDFYPITGVPNWYLSGKVGTQRRRLKPAL